MVPAPALARPVAKAYVAWGRWSAMMMSADHGIVASRRLPAIAAAAGLVGGVVVAATLLLWIHYGTAVFFDTIAAGLAACF